jgi:hypothetical protein
MRIAFGLLMIGILGATGGLQSDEPADIVAPAAADEASMLPGQADFELHLKSESEQYERATLRYDEATERARLNYIKTLDDNLSDLGEEDTNAARYQSELARVRAMKFRSPKFEYTKFRWDYNQPPVRMIHKDEGICYFTGIAGAFDGGAEAARVYIGDDGYWYLHGSSGRGFMVLEAIAVKMAR